MKEGLRSMYSYPITPEEMRIIFEGFCEVATNYPTSRGIALKYAEYFDYDSTSQGQIKEYHYFGYGKTKEYCCYLTSILSPEQLSITTEPLKPWYFDHKSAHWGGSATITQTKSKFNKTPIGPIIPLVKPLSFYGNIDDYDDLCRGYSWRFTITSIQEVV